MQVVSKPINQRGNYLSRNIIAVIFVPLLLLLVVYPLVALFAHLNLEGVSRTLADSNFWICVKNTLISAILAAVLGVVLAIGFGYLHLFKRKSVIYKIANLMNDLPIAIPHTVAGLALLLAFGRNMFGFIGNTGLAFTLFAVILAMFFVSYPLAARNMAASVDNMDMEIVNVARTLGDSPAKAYFRVVLPTSGVALFSSFVLATSRSISEFAAVIMFGGNVPGKTEVLASYVFSKVEIGEFDMAVTASVFCTLISLIMVALLTLRKRFS